MATHADLSCWDCALFDAAYGVRCQRHRSAEEQRMLEAGIRAVERRIAGSRNPDDRDPGEGIE